VGKGWLETKVLAAQRWIEAVVMDAHCLLLSLHVTASVGFLVKPMV